jgi:hypothetical protein
MISWATIPPATLPHNAQTAVWPLGVGSRLPYDARISDIPTRRDPQPPEVSELHRIKRRPGPSFVDCFEHNVARNLHHDLNRIAPCGELQD